MEIVLAAMVVLTVAIVAGLAIAQSGEPPVPGKPAPAFRLQGIDGTESELPGPQGSRAVLVFHPQDDTPECVAVVRRLSELAPAVESAGVSLQVVVVSAPEAARDYAKTHDTTFRVLCDPDGRAAKAYGALVNLVFTRFARKLIVVVDSHGRVERTWRDAVGPRLVGEVLGSLSPPER